MSFRENIKKVVPYTPGEQPVGTGIIKLNTNENPYPPAPGVREAMLSYPADRLRLYPDPQVSELVSAIAAYHGVNREQVFVGVGSDDVIAMAFMTFFAGEKEVLFPDITYSFYDVWCELFGIPFRRIPLDENLKIDPEDYKAEKGGVIIPNPNAPTGIYEPLDTIRTLLEASGDCAVMIDEAYIDFAGASALELLDKYENLLVIRTFSKSRSMAGVRIGYCIGSPELIGYLNDVKFSFNSYTMNSLTIKMGVASIEDDAYFKEMVERVKATRERTVGKLRTMGFELPDSGANFVFARHPELPGEIIFKELKERGIYVRYFKKPRIDDRIRISIGTDEEMDRLFGALEEIINGHQNK